MNKQGNEVELAAQAIAAADALLIGAGAGIGVDSGLPNFRGEDGFWKAYPPLREKGLSFLDLANPAAFRDDPEQAWGFYGHRLKLYSESQPHHGFSLLKQWAEKMSAGYFVFTSNVDGQFQKAGFPEDCIVECHGSISWLQCQDRCWHDLWPAEGVAPDIDLSTFRATPPLPLCPRCSKVARPNILMFDDGDWISDRTLDQERKYRSWLEKIDRQRLVIVEVGAGTSIPSVRYHSESLGSQLIRINPDEFDVPAEGIGLSCGGLEGLESIQAKLAW